jgi:hypothetical protein
MPEERINIFALSEIFGLTTSNSEMYVMLERRNADAGQHRYIDSYIWA